MLNQTAGLGIDDGIRVERELLTEYRRSSRDSLEGLEGFQRRAR
jgi:hypothetical protein